MDLKKKKKQLFFHNLEAPAKRNPEGGKKTKTNVPEINKETLEPDLVPWPEFTPSFPGRCAQGSECHWVARLLGQAFPRAAHTGRPNRGRLVRQGLHTAVLIHSSLTQTSRLPPIEAVLIP